MWNADLAWGRFEMLAARRGCALVLAAIAGTLAACASPQSIARLDTARSDFKEKARPAQMRIQYDLAKPGRLTPTERKRREVAAETRFRRRARSLTPKTCTPTATPRPNR